MRQIAQVYVLTHVSLGSVGPFVSTASTISTSAGYALVVFLVASATYMGTGRRPNVWLVTAGLALSALLGLTSASDANTVDVLLKPVAGRGTAVTLAMGVGMAVATALVARSTRPTPSVGRALLAVSLGVFSLKQFVVAFLASNAVPGSARWFAVWYGGAVDVALVLLVTVAVTAYLMEEERRETSMVHKEVATVRAALQNSEDYFRQLIDGAADIVTVIDAGGFIRYESPAVERLLGWKDDEHIGKHALTRIHPDDQAHIAAAITRTIAGQTLNERVAYRYQHRNGEWRDLESQGRELTGAGTERRIVVNSRDITESKKLERQLLQAQKMESVGRLAGGVAHDFNNMLTVILANATLARQATELGHPARDDLNEVVHAAERAAKLTKQLLSFSRHQTVELRPVDLSALTSSVLQMLRRVVGEDLDFVTQLDAGLPRVLADSGQIEQVLTNLVMNARDAMPTGGTLRVTTFALELRDVTTFESETLPPGLYVALSVSDTGMGVAPDVRPHVFEPFFTTKADGKGTGLGLASCYGIVKRHEGFIWLESAQTSGCTFVVALPTIRAGVVHEFRRAVGPVSNLYGSEHVLLVEDDALVRSTTERILVEYGYRVTIATDGEEALRRFDSVPAIDVVVTDIVMPRMDGIALAMHLRLHHDDLPIVLVSGYSDRNGELSEALTRRAQLVPKPFTPAELVGAVRGLLDQYAARSCVDHDA